MNDEGARASDSFIVHRSSFIVLMKRYPYYPIYLDIEDRSVVIIGGGNVCARKAETMMKYGARVTVVSPEFTDEIEQWAREGSLSIRRKPYEAADLDGANIVIASTDDQRVNEQIAADCRARRIPVNVVDVTPLCEFIVPAIIEKGSIQIAVSTGGKSPALARTLKEDLQRAIGPEYAEVNDVLGTLREEAKRVLPTDVDRKRFFDGIIASGVLEMLRDGRRRQAYQVIADACGAAEVPLSDAVRAGLG
jgi:siroheme synthase-like protein